MSIDKPPRPPTRHQTTTPYRATDELEERLGTCDDVTIDGGGYVAKAALCCGPLHAEVLRIYSAWTESEPFVVGCNSKTLQDALDSVDSAYRAALKTMPPGPVATPAG